MHASLTHHDDRVFSVALAFGIAGVSLLTHVNFATAQTASGGQQIAQIEEIIVTTRRKEESLQDVPLTITAFDAQSLQGRGATSLTDIAALTTGFNFEPYSNGGYPVPTIRGLTATSILSFENNVSSFLGDIYLPRAYMIDIGLAGLERVEVVKGPQSALYGRNAFAGAINYVPLAPPDELLATGLVTVGTNKRLDFSATLGGPVIDERFSIVGGMAHSEFDGTWRNAHPDRDIDADGTKGRMGGYDNESYFAAATLTPNDDLSLTLGYNRTEKDTEAQGRYGLSRNTGDANCSLVGGVLQFFCGEMPINETIVDPRSQGLEATTEIYRADLTYAFSDNYSFRYLFGYIDSDAFSYDQNSVNSITGDSPAGVSFLGIPVGGIKGPSHEVRLAYSDEGTELAVGAYASNLTDNYSTRISFQPPRSSTPVTPSTPGQIVVQNSETKIKNRSVSFQGSQDLADGKFNVSVEGRYMEERKTVLDRIASRTDSVKFKNFTPRLVAKWNFLDEANVYASAAKGVKSGGSNSGNILNEERAFGPETNWTYELGMKGNFLDRRLAVNVALFYVDWSGLQTLGQSANPAFLGTITRNIGTASTEGVEVDVTALVTDGLTASGSFSYSDPEYGENLIDPRYLLLRSAAGQPILVCDNVTCPSNGSIGGNTLARQSKTQATGSLRYDGTAPIGSDTTYWLGADVSYKSKQFVDPLLLTWVPARTLVNVNTGLDFGNVTLEVWGRNIFDKKYVSGVTYNLSPNTNIRYQAAMHERQTFGITARIRY